MSPSKSCHLEYPLFLRPLYFFLLLHIRLRNPHSAQHIKMQAKFLTSIALFSVLSLAQLNVDPGLVSSLPNPPHHTHNLIPFLPGFESKQRLQTRRLNHQSKPHPRRQPRRHSIRRPRSRARRSITRPLSPISPTRQRNHYPRLVQQSPNVGSQHLHHRFRQAQ